PRRREADEPPTRLQQPGDAIDEHEVTEMIGTELRLETIRGLALRACHHAGIGDDDVERLACLDQGVGTGTHAPEVSQIERHELETSTTLLGCLPYCFGGV